jgi:hypothetical protein
MNPKFLEGVDGFKAMLKDKLAPKKSIKEEECVTGEGVCILTFL